MHHINLYVIVDQAGFRSVSAAMPASTNTEDSDSNIIRPDDYAPGTNEKVWVRLDSEPIVGDHQT